MASWGVKRILFAGNKSDGESVIDKTAAEKWLQENNISNYYVCATNNVGTQELFIDLDKVNDDGGSLYTLNCLQGKKSEHARPLLQEGQEISLMQLAWLSFRAEMKFYENKAKKGSYYIRSDLNDVLAIDIEREHQIDEIK